MKKLPSLQAQGQKSNPNPKFLGTAKAYFVCHIGPNFQISLIFAFIGTVTESADFGFIPDNATTLTPPGSTGVSNEAQLSTEFEFGPKS